MTSVAEFRQQASAFLQERFPPLPDPQPPTFSAFDRQQVQLATELAREFADIAATRGDLEGIADVLAAARDEATRRSPSLVKYALLIFLTHDPIGSRVGPPSLEERHPDAVAGMIETQAERTASDPTSLSFFRDDVFANDHHAHWHEVYLSDYRPQERQGEIFLYMHQQMLARYDAERLAVERPPVSALDVDGGRIAEGFDPKTPRFGARPDDAAFPRAAEFAARRAAFGAAIGNDVFEAAYERGYYNPELDLTGPQPVLSLLGAALEAEGAPLRFEFTGLNTHNSGHGAIASISNPLGVMRDPAVAIRDPVFWEWHKLIDDIGAAWQERQPERDFSAAEDRLPEVILRGSADDPSRDLIICRRGDLELADFDDVDAGAALGEQLFGGEHWDADFSDSSPGTSELLTTMAQRTSDVGEVSYLDMVDEFAVFLRMENESAAPVDVTARIFLVANEWRDDRRSWIELDKFLWTVPPGRSVAYRPSSLSSVIRRPATRPPAPAPVEDGHQPSAYCQCGWPYNLLLPRGTKHGMPFRMLALLTDAGWDRATEDPCGSMSFCGVRDSTYPDRRNMGYPFDRRLAGGVTSALGGLPSAGMRPLTIRWV